MQFTKSELEMIYKYACTTKEDTVKAMKEALSAIGDELTYIIIRNAAEKLGKLPEPECSRFIADNQKPRCKQRGIKLAALQSSGVFDPRGIRQISMQTWLFSSLLAGIKRIT